MSDLVTIFQSGDIALLALAKAALEAADIPYIAEGEGIQDFFGAGRLGSTYNFVTGAPRIRVTAEHAERARQLLDDLRE